MPSRSAGPTRLVVAGASPFAAVAPAAPAGDPVGIGGPLALLLVGAVALVVLFIAVAARSARSSAGPRRRKTVDQVDPWQEAGRRHPVPKSDDAGEELQ